MVSFLALIIINISKSINFESKFYIVLDYIFIFLGKGSLIRSTPTQNLIFFYFLSQEIPLKPYHNKYLVIIWCFSSMILMNYLVNNILSTLISRKAYRIETIEQLTDEKNLRIIVEKYSQTHKIIEKVMK
jgi:hypothetical protein